MYPQWLCSSGILLTRQAPSLGHWPCSISCCESTQSVSMVEKIFLERLSEPSYSAGHSHSLIRKSI